MAVDWCSLPNDLLGNIAIKLETIVDFIYFSSVCRSWNHASLCVKHLWNGDVLPCLLLAENIDNKDSPNGRRKIFNLENDKCYNLTYPKTTLGSRCWGSPYGWVAMVMRDHKVQLFNPFTTANIQFPSCETLPDPEPPDYFPGIEHGYDYYEWFMRYYLWKLIVVKVCHDDGHTEFIIMALYDIWNTCKLAFARHGDQSWTPVLFKEKQYCPIVDLVSMDDYVYGVYLDGTIAYWNVKEFLVPEEPVKATDFSLNALESYNGNNNTYLVQSGSDLLLLKRNTKVEWKKLKDELNSDGDEESDDSDSDSDYDYDSDRPQPVDINYYDGYEISYETLGFKVYKFNLADKKWEETVDVGNVALFVGCNYSMSVRVTSRSCLKPNCIYFTDDEDEAFRRATEGGGHDMGFFNIKSVEIFQFYDDSDDERFPMWPPIWFIPTYW